MANKFRLSVQNVDMGGSNDSSDEEITGIEPYGLERGRDYENLCHLLRICAIKHVDGTIGRFWPRAILDRIMTRDRIFQELSTYQSQSLTNGAEEQKHNVHQLADIIHAQYRVIFAILNLLMKGYCIQDFIREQLKDDDLPLIKQKRSWASVLQRRLSNGYVPSDCRATEKWHPHERDIFADLQYQLSPVFLDMEPNGRDIKDLRLDSCAVLPFMEKDHRGQGGYGLVNRVKIHPECHAFRDILSSVCEIVGVNV
jgi:hypothetical protein